MSNHINLSGFEFLNPQEVQNLYSAIDTIRIYHFRSKHYTQGTRELIKENPYLMTFFRQKERFFPYIGVTLAVIHSGEFRVFGVSYCNDNDKCYNKKVGSSLALHRALNKFTSKEADDRFKSNYYYGFEYNYVRSSDGFYVHGKVKDGLVRVNTKSHRDLTKKTLDEINEVFEKSFGKDHSIPLIAFLNREELDTIINKKYDESTNFNTTYSSGGEPQPSDSSMFLSHKDPN